MQRDSHGRRARALLLTLVSTIGVASCDWSDPGRAEVEPLLARRASKSEVIAKLGAGSTWYGPGGDGSLEAFLAREPPGQYKPVRAALAEERGVLFYTTAWQQTWLFFDASDRLVGYWFNTQ